MKNKSSHYKQRIFSNNIAVIVLLTLLSILPNKSFAQSNAYYPGRGDNWEHHRPEEVGMDSQLLQEAVDYAIENAQTEPKSMEVVVAKAFAGEPFNTIIGPTLDRDESSGMIIRNGYIVAEWGDTRRVDMTFSATKSYLSTMAGLAIDRGFIQDVHEPVKNYVQEGLFDSEHNAKITWHHLLTQTSDWQGTLWGKPDWADRPEGEPETWENRELHEPGTYMKYNDVRVNLLALTLLHVWRRPLPQVLRDEIMEPIGASTTWRWHGYENSWVMIDGINMQSVSGGGHWGGGMHINTRDHARFGYLFLRNGEWNGKQLISKEWIKMMTKPTPVRTDYGYMWWLNTDRERVSNAPESSYFAAGFGGNYVWVDSENDLVVVIRWIPDLQGVMERVLASIKDSNQ